LGLQEKYLGEKLPALQLKDEVLGVYPSAQANVQLLPWSTLEPSRQEGFKAFAIRLEALHGLGWQENVDGEKLPKLQLKDEELGV